MPLIALVTGDRRWDDFGVVAREIDGLPPHSVVITTGQGNVDRWAEEAAMNRDDLMVITTTRTANKHGQTRGGAALKYLRDMRREGHDIIVIVVHADLEGDRFGHAPQVVRLARLADITVRLVEG